MLSKYGRALCIVAVCCSGAVARSESFVPRSFSNATSSSMTAASSSLTTTQTSLSLSSVDPTTSGSSTVPTDLPLISSSITSRDSTSNRVPLVTPAAASSSVGTTSPGSTVNSPTSSTQGSSSIQSTSLSSISLSTSSSVTSTIHVASGRNSSRTTTQHSSSRIDSVSTTTSRGSSNGPSNITSSFISTTTPACFPITSINGAESQCISYCQVATSFVFATNTTETVTQLVTIFRNSTSLSRTHAPRLTTSQVLPLQPCFTPIGFNSVTSLETFTSIPSPPAASQAAQSLVISYITSKTTVTSLVTAPSISFDGPGVQDKSTVNPTTDTQPQSVTPVHPQSLQQASMPSLAGPKSNPTADPSPVPPSTNGQSQAQGPIQTSSPTVVVNGVPIILPGNSVIIGSTTLSPNVETTAVTVNGKVFTVNPSQIIAQGTTIARPAPNQGAAPTSGPTPTVVQGVTIAIGSSIAILGSSTYQIGPGALPTTTIINGQTVSIGPGGVAIGSTTLQPAGSPNPAPQTQITTINGVALTEIGSTVLLGSQTFTLGPQAKPTTIVVNGQTFSIGPGGIGSQSTTLFAPPNPTQVITTAGLTLTEISSSLVVLDGTTFTLGAQATPTTEVLNGVTISIGPGGIGIAGLTTIAPPPPGAAATAQTKAITAGGITFSEIGSSLVVIGSSTFTIGPGATPTTDVYNGVTISIGPGGVGFASTTVPYAGGPTATGVRTVTTNGAGGGFGRGSRWVLVLGVLMGAGAVL